ncbi:HD domain-containing protein [Hirsutella rhossiliensis]|uniref:HD domain-containing protein n=1 Tax=Hirsutella rhossiliensis TaxID=111463 RepID=A0A9P8MNM5_9HYPO|nr:HD domain-containing protein [Hirsutella rhossiliensis]KAH0959518.1 HD domain-containing protein [Hirsutella rhossiliensis]
MTMATVNDGLIARVTDYVRDYMSHYDGSHDFHHIERVLRLALHIQARTPSTSRPLVALCALLHDVGDSKYLRPGEDGSRLVADVLRSLGADARLADTVQAICLGVSYSTEVRDPAAAAARLAAHPELAVVQDADRLDAIGAVGIARTFAFGGAKGRALGQTMDHFDDKLVRLEAMMKTETGRALARQRTERLKLMQAWWREETEGHGLDDAGVVP